MISTHSTITIRVSEPGRSRKIVHLPSPIATALRICASAKGPRIMPTTTGAAGKSKRRMTTPKRPIAYSSTRSNALWRMPYTPSVENTRMPAYRYDLGMFSSLTHRPTSGRFRISSITLPMYIDAISAHTMAPLVSKSCGPGWMP